MIALARQRWCVATALVVPLLTLASPGILKLAGVAPSWAVLWLLPWALVDGPLSGALAGLGVALLLDGLHPGPLSQLPALLVLGWWWGRLGRGSRIQRSFSLGLLALLGSAALGATLALQQWFWQLQDPVTWRTVLAQSLITALLAPLLCSLQLLLWRRSSQAFGPAAGLRS
jgi:rod shape-determining protein MreD